MDSGEQQQTWNEDIQEKRAIYQHHPLEYDPHI
jgi:hypothetical protein